MNPDVKPGDTIRAVRITGYPADGDDAYASWFASLQDYYTGKAGVVVRAPDRNGDVSVKFDNDYPGEGCVWWVSDWEFLTPAPDPLTHLTDHVGSPATLTIAGRTYTATLAHAHEHVKFERGTAIRADITIRVELTDIKGQA